MIFKTRLQIYKESKPHRNVKKKRPIPNLFVKQILW